MGVIVVVPKSSKFDRWLFWKYNDCSVDVGHKFMHFLATPLGPPPQTLNGVKN
jgi:hypothetical protein